ncbi:MAG: acetoacetate--CoA ligase [Burkholderiales bacterium]|nr:acetoacetate--CoA ligase [Burkholderiales bacterium]
MTTDNILWEPGQAALEKANLTQFARGAVKRWKLKLNTYPDFLKWSIDSPEQYWMSVWEQLGVIGIPAEPKKGVRMPPGLKAGALMRGETLAQSRWFPGMRMNFAQNLLRKHDSSEAIIFWGEDKVKRKVTWAELNNQVSRCAQGLKAAGVRQGDRVAAIMPNMPEAVIGMIATASIGAIWTSCSPDFGIQGVLDRFGQVEPKVLFAPDGYYYGGKSIDMLDKVSEIVMRLPSVREAVVVPYLAASPNVDGVPRALTWPEFTAPYKAGPVEYNMLPFEQPMLILYSSGTTGVPKCIVHSAGGILLKHLAEHQLHCDVRPGDRVFYSTNCGWMMWNWLVTALGSGATLILYDGSPFLRRGAILWDMAQAEKVTHFGTSAKYIDALAKIRLRPRDSHELNRMRVLLSTGSPLAPEAFDYVYQAIKPEVMLGSISGGTDICGCFVMGNPVLPVRRGECTGNVLGMDVQVFDERGRALGPGKKGELVCAKPFPSMPVGFWNDEDGSRYRAAYFERFAGVWHHGDYVERTPSGGLIFHGRSDATLNPGGVRIGTGEIYRHVEALDEVTESLVIAQEWPPGKRNDVRVVLFVRLRDGVVLDSALTEKIKQQIRVNTTAQHAPAKVIQVADIPRTRSGKLVELAVRDVVHNLPVKNIEALANPEALDLYRNLPELAAA